MKQKVIASIWFTPMIPPNKTIGIVKVNNWYQDKYYIGYGLWLNQEDDEQIIAQNWAPFFPESFPLWK